MIASLQEELRLKDQRFERIPAHRRPNYFPEERLEILELRAINGWSQAKTAKKFHLSKNTISSWKKRLDEQGADGLLRIGVPVNKFPEFVCYVVQWLKILCPRMGKKRIADMLCRAGLVLATTTAGRFIKEIEDAPPEDSAKVAAIVEESMNDTDAESDQERIVTAKYPHHVWHIDLTAVPIGGGFWTSWLPNVLPQCWPFCWWVIAVIDHFSRRVIGFAIFRKVPNSQQVQDFLDNAIAKEGQTPKYIISDKGVQFWCESYKAWAEDKGIKLRFGAIGKHGSIAVIERFFLSLKDEATRIVNVPLNQAEFQKELEYYCGWYNGWRPIRFWMAELQQKRAIRQRLNPQIDLTPGRLIIIANPTNHISRTSNSRSATIKVGNICNHRTGRRLSFRKAYLYRWKALRAINLCMRTWF